MDHPSSFIVGTLLLVSSAALIVWHQRVWQRLREADLSNREYDFRRRQCRRRVQTSALLGVLGAAILIGQLLMPVIQGWILLAYWVGALLLVVWIVLLALADMAATSYFYTRERSHFALERAKLEAELRKARGNGDSDDGHGDEGHAKNGKPR